MTEGLHEPRPEGAIYNLQEVLLGDPSKLTSAQAVEAYRAAREIASSSNIVTIEPETLGPEDQARRIESARQYVDEVFDDPPQS